MTEPIGHTSADDRTHEHDEPLKHIDVLSRAALTPMPPALYLTDYEAQLVRLAVQRYRDATISDPHCTRDVHRDVRYAAQSIKRKLDARGGA